MWGLGQLILTDKSEIPKLRASVKKFKDIKTVQQAKEWASGSFHAAKNAASKLPDGAQRELYEIAANTYANAYRLSATKTSAGATVFEAGTASKVLEGMKATILQGDATFQRAKSMSGSMVAVEKPSAMETASAAAKEEAKIPSLPSIKLPFSFKTLAFAGGAALLVGAFLAFRK